MTDVIMPQMGESIAEGTITKWLKNVGDKVERDEPLFEISTDKVDAEIPSPAAGVLKEIRVQPGTTVPINTVVGVIAADGAAAAAPAPAPAPAAAAPAPRHRLRSSRCPLRRRLLLHRHRRPHRPRRQPQRPGRARR
jgi:2-oxoglutarate dehydrogenase E2 component (dihydrolipoamide succinyltransferase)